MICCSRIIAGDPGLAQAEIKTCCWSSSLVQLKQMMAVVSARPLQNKQCVKSSQKGLGYLGESSKEAHPQAFLLLLAFFKESALHIYFPSDHREILWIQKVVLTGYANHSCKLLPTAIPTLPWLHPYHSLTFHFITKKSHSSIVFNWGKKPQRNKFCIPFKGSNEVTMVFSGNGPIFA